MGADDEHTGNSDPADAGDQPDKTATYDTTEQSSNSLAAEVETLRGEVEQLESVVESRTIDRSDLKSELEEYVRSRVRRSKARGWGPYLILLYGSLTSIAAFYLLSDLVAILAMMIVFLSTLGLYVLFILIGVTLRVLGTPTQAARWYRNRGE
ncbi:MAG: hypothetical protein J07HQX50_02767 [Haloquadratum sp. J07HQX50]|jgi:hypothetical protein|nr:MAG: hypothetical protein J07HQX50_02767 [Haloquadratum sp. J07HQX50]